MPLHSSGWTEEDHENLRQNSRSQGRELNRSIRNVKQEDRPLDSDIRNLLLRMKTVGAVNWPLTPYSA
jgi:hypothetical protein